MNCAMKPCTGASCAFSDPIAAILSLMCVIFEVTPPELLVHRGPHWLHVKLLARKLSQSSSGMRRFDYHYMVQSIWGWTLVCIATSGSLLWSTVFNNERCGGV